MPQQINLLDASLLRRREALGFATGGVAMLATLGLAGALAWGLQALGSQTAARAGELETDLAALQARAAPTRPAAPSRDALELGRLHAVEAGQQRVRAALDAGQVGTPQGYSGFLLALSRQTRPSLWLTGFTVAADGRALELRGRMTDPRRLPDYLRRLNAEPLFKGREFAQLSLKTVPTVSPEAATGAGASDTEFALRSAGSAAEATR